MAFRLTQVTADPTPNPSPTPVPAGIDENWEFDYEQLLLRFDIDPDNLPRFDLPSVDMILAVLVIAGAVLLLRAMYRGMQRPRLALTYHDDRPPTASRKAVLRYLVTPLVWVPLWFYAVLGILVLASNRGEGFRPVDQMVIAAAAVVGGSRVLAYVNAEGAHELAKSVPLTLLSLILISGQTIGFEAFLVVSLLLVVNIDSLSLYVLLLALVDVVVTALWLVRRRRKWRREAQGLPPQDGILARLRRLVSDAWGANDSGPAQRQAAPTGDQDAGAPTTAEADAGAPATADR